VARIVAAWIFLGSLLTGCGVLGEILREPFHPQLIVLLVFFGFLTHVFGSVAFRGHAPKYLQFSRGPK
jgi:fatty acid desaturase